MNYCVIDYYTGEVVLDGCDYETCVEWIMNQGETLSNGLILYRVWQETDGTVYDMGRVYKICHSDRFNL